MDAPDSGTDPRGDGANHRRRVLVRVSTRRWVNPVAEREALHGNTSAVRHCR